MTEYFKLKEKYGEKLSKNRASAFMLCNKNSCKVYRSDVHKKYFYLEQIIQNKDSFEVIKDNVAILSTESGKKKLQREILEVFNQTITANYYKMDVGAK